MSGQPGKQTSHISQAPKTKLALAITFQNQIWKSNGRPHKLRKISSPKGVFRMPTLPAELLPLIVEFAPLFSKPVWERAKTLLVGAILAIGNRTVTACLRVTGNGQDKRFQNYHRVRLSTRWSALRASQVLLRMLLTTFAPSGELIIGWFMGILAVVLVVGVFWWVRRRNRAWTFAELPGLLEGIGAQPRAVQDRGRSAGGRIQEGEELSAMNQPVFILAGTPGEYTAARQQLNLTPPQAYWLTGAVRLKGMSSPTVYRVGSWRTLTRIEAIEAAMAEVKADIIDL
jgi:hypothetical protein